MFIDQRYFYKDGRLNPDAPKAIKTKFFLLRAYQVHSIKYTYNKFEYPRTNKLPITVTCRVHGDFTTSINNFINKASECPLCANKKRNKERILSTEEFNTRASSLHKNKYDYSLVKYIGMATKVTIICPKHGEFMQLPKNHLYLKHGCPICACEKLSSYKDLTTRGIYILRSSTLGCFKIGISNNVHRRIREVNSEYVDFILINFYDLNSNEHSMKLEKALHQHFKDKQCKDFLETDLDGKTELFNLNEEDIQYIDRYIKSYCADNNIHIG